MIVDLRSDTVTKPSAEMLETMMNAPVGDDVFGEDSTINQLEQKTAEIFGLEAGIFCPSGTMTNQIAINVHTQPGDEIVCDQFSHVYLYEGGGVAKNSGVTCKLIDGNRGRLNLSMIQDEINPDDVHRPNTSLISLENTSNKGGGSCYNHSDIKEIRSWCTKNNLKFHLDGARLYNAIVANQESPKFYGKHFDSISLCLSKGLGAPVGSVLLGSKDFIHQARRVRKVFGGGMRQAGFLAAAGIYALDNNVDRLENDHLKAKRIGQALEANGSIKSVYPVETNIVIAAFDSPDIMEKMIEYLEANQIQVVRFGKDKLRMVTHLDINDDMMNYLIEKINKYEA